MNASLFTASQPLLWRIAFALTLIMPVAMAVSRAAADVCLIFVCLLFLAHSVKQRDFGWLQERWVQLALLLWAYMTLRSIFTIEMEEALRRAFFWIRFPLFAAAASHWVLPNAAARRLLFKVLVGAACFLVADTLIQYFFGMDLLMRPPTESEGAQRLTGPYSSPIVGIVMVWTAFPVLFGLLLTQEGKMRSAAKLIPGILFALAFLTAVFLTGERMALLLCGLGLVLAPLLLPVPLRLVLGMGVGAVLLMGTFAYFHPEKIERQVVSTVEIIKHLPDTNYGKIWGSALSIAEQHPLFGVGARHFRVHCPMERYGPVDEASLVMRCNLHPHNYLLEWLSEFGLVGIGLFFAMVACWLGKVWRLFPAYRRDPVFTGITLALLLRLWPLASTTSFFISWSAVIFWLVVAWLLAYAVADSNTKEQA